MNAQLAHIHIYDSMMIPYRFTIFLLDYEIKFNAIMLRAGKWMRERMSKRTRKTKSFLINRKGNAHVLDFYYFEAQASVCFRIEKWLVAVVFCATVPY